MPAAARADSQYLRGTDRVSKTSDNDRTTTTLGDSEEACVVTTPRDTVPEFIQVHEYPEEIEPSIDAKKSGNILPDEPSWPQLAQHPSGLMPQTAAFIG